MAKASGKARVSPGEIVTAKIDFAEINDLYLQTVYSFYEMGGERIWDKNRAAFVFDHYAPCPTIESARNHAEMRTFAQKNDLTYHFDISCGVCHQVMPEHGLVYPGMIVVATDSHTTTHGAFGALGTGVGATDMACVLITGELWMRVPQIINIRLEGEPPAGVFAKDVILNVIGALRADGAVYKGVEFTGSYVDSLGVSERMVLCNMALEMGAKTAYIQPNQQVIDYVTARAVRPFEVERTDPGFTYAEEHVFELDRLTPQLAFPNSVDNVYALEKGAGVKIDQGLIGTCTGGRVEDIAVAAEILNGKKIADWVRLLIIPASKEVMRICMERHYIQSLMDAGATIASPGCGPCLGAHEGVLAAGEVCITASNRNFPGRMGSSDSKLYLASPASVAASVLKGVITDPREFLGGNT
ncbi:MAG: 3-isopropylmalate dehydratase large subunit [Faecalispora sporosphaeroides]|uniref:3-isopropylmalate dehydratase large subunit n=1 Tax=Faecalispora TaxID=3115229 RepID=UPI001FA757FA|nr:3-isopropylmalate dehydratase large subunit [Faecalispora jeddahensis]